MTELIGAAEMPELPYGEDFLFIDRVVAFRTGERIETEKFYSALHPIVAAHFARGPKLVPGLILAEQICQSALLLGIRSGLFDGPSLPLLGEVKARFPQPALADCVISATVTIDACLRRAVSIEGHAFCSGAPVCILSAIIVVPKPDFPPPLTGED